MAAAAATTGGLLNLTPSHAPTSSPSFALFGASYGRHSPRHPRLCPVLAVSSVAAGEASYTEPEEALLEALVGVQGRGRAVAPRQLKEVESAVQTLEALDGVPDPVGGSGSGGAPKPKRQRPRRLHRNEDGVFVDSAVIQQRRRDEQREQAAKEKKRQSEVRKKGKQQRPNYKTMDSPNYILVRTKDWYEEDDRDFELDDQSYWCAEQEYIFRDIYANAKKPIRHMSAIDLTYLSTRPEFSDAYDVLDQLGLFHLMSIQCNYNPQLVLQFYATLVICGDDQGTLKWMSGTEYYESSWTQFADLLGYNIGEGHRIHSAADHDKNKLADLYDANGVIGYIQGLLPLYAPSGGNNDGIQTSLVEFLAHAQECYENDVPGKDFRLDVMDYIYRETYDAMISRGTVPYAPYIMLLIKNTVTTSDLSEDGCVEHKCKKPYKIKAKQPVAPYPTTSATFGFMRDARSSGGHSKKAPTRSIGMEVKKLNWWEKNVLCLKTEIHKENYQGYRERRELFHQNATILHHVTKAPGPPPQQSAPIAYKDWNNSQVNWVELEKQLYGVPAAPSRTPPSAADDSEAEYESDDDRVEATESESESE